MNNTHHHESGYTMIGVLIIFIIIAVLGLSIVTLSFASVKTSTNERDFQSAYYIAEAGLTQQMEKTIKEIMDIYESDHVRTEEDFFKEIKVITGDVEYNAFEKVDGVKPVAEISIDLLGEENNQFSIQSTGKIGKQERTVTHSFSVEWQEKFKENETYELPPLTVFTSGSMLLNTGTIAGSIGTKSTERYAIKSGSGDPKVQQGDIYVSLIGEAVENRTCQEIPVNEYKAYSVSRPTWENNVPCPIEVDEMWELPKLPEFPETPQFEPHVDPDIYLLGNQKLNVELANNKAFKNITLTAGTTLVFNVGSTDKSITIDYLDLSNGFIELTGTGKLTIYVKDQMTMSADSVINNDGDINRVNIFYKGMDQVKLSGAQKIYGSLYAKQANLSLKGSGGIRGNIFTGGNKIELSGGSNIEAQLILAPHAAVNMGGSGTVHGRIISKRFTNDGEAHIGFAEPFVLDGPISPAALGESSGNNSNNDGTNTELAGNTPTITTTPTREVSD